MLEVAAVCLVTTALLACLTVRYPGLPMAIGKMAASLALVVLAPPGLARGVHQYEEAPPRSIDFSKVLMQGMPSMRLFAGESLFNDGVGMVIFLLLLDMMASGGISVALALWMPAGTERDTVVALTHGVVVFSTFVQGLSVGRAAPRSVAGH